MSGLIRVLHQNWRMNLIEIRDLQLHQGDDWHEPDPGPCKVETEELEDSESPISIAGPRVSDLMLEGSRTLATPYSVHRFNFDNASWVASMHAQADTPD